MSGGHCRRIPQAHSRRGECRCGVESVARREQPCGDRRLLSRYCGALQMLRLKKLPDLIAEGPVGAAVQRLLLPAVRGRDT